jgi:hypothetical protein
MPGDIRYCRNETGREIPGIDTANHQSLCVRSQNSQEDSEKMTKTACNSSMTRTLTTGESVQDNETWNQDRRRFLKLNLLGLVLAPTESLFASQGARVGRTGRIVNTAPTLLDPEDTHARALNYRARSSKSVQSCGNCRLYTGKEGGRLGPCAIFSYRAGANGHAITHISAGPGSTWAGHTDPHLLKSSPITTDGARADGRGDSKQAVRTAVR